MVTKDKLKDYSAEIHQLKIQSRSWYFGIKNLVIKSDKFSIYNSKLKGIFLIKISKDVQQNAKQTWIKISQQ